ncbi:MAG: hypothetical protein A2648_02680 [Candidatus Lloydbacteria bacterium RIFCSPHIGHO2_01_FULL_41_20]|uniref:Uncharacterized protein n=1 Tax=Candidatus Lloydbacteria bacterium RIFCSPHIGHO2_01_FULL_41_20 TaxID=1798657 RepID=A0A1G2CR23_9BACT|nr:MAG: hypothetical protein A2648_02680 [Candidatus Lloydbacteria bacterium RIFCSPHIGHO2_01_FULL_41_20]
MEEIRPRDVFFAFSFRGCRPGSLVAQVSEKELGDIFEKMVKDAGFTPAARYLKIYPNADGVAGKGGYTAEITLEESSANVYTWPEDGDAVGDIFYCNYERDNSDKFKKLYTALCQFFNPQEVETFGPFRIYRRKQTPM